MARTEPGLGFPEMECMDAQLRIITASGCYSVIKRLPASRAASTIDGVNDLLPKATGLPGSVINTAAISFIGVVAETAITGTRQILLYQDPPRRAFIGRFLNNGHRLPGC